MNGLILKKDFFCFQIDVANFEFFFASSRQSIAYSHKNVKICASHAGLTLGEDGATHQILEDIGMMKMLPGMTVINPCDYCLLYTSPSPRDRG